MPHYMPHCATPSMQFSPPYRGFKTVGELQAAWEAMDSTLQADLTRVRGELASYKVENQHLVERIAEKVNDKATLRSQLSALQRGHDALAEQLQKGNADG